ncbi:MAG: Ig-like domain-containing protein, partial [SAR324 cluster bacterium]|nr:Ig-like domain-containing protein [SAR324 cluster bacterium]
MRFSFLLLILGLLFLLAGCFESTPEVPKVPKAKPKQPTPEVVSVSPTDNGTTVSLLPKIEVRFSLSMDSNLG